MNVQTPSESNLDQSELLETITLVRFSEGIEVWARGSNDDKPLFYLPPCKGDIKDHPMLTIAMTAFNCGRSYQAKRIRKVLSER